MLKGISPIISPELLKCLASMGHGDTILIGDCNYPAESTSNKCIYADGVRATELLDAVVTLLPLDTGEDEPPVILMCSRDEEDNPPAVWKDFKKIVLKYEPKAAFEAVDRFEFYKRAPKTFVSVRTSEQAYFGCIILRKGVWFTK
ncbi:MAG: RbsD/FucU family protein [Velocimicrobium sp.]